MEDRISSLESLTLDDPDCHMTMRGRIMNEQAEEWTGGRMEAERGSGRRWTEEQQRQAEERQRERDELLQQLLQAVAVMQADIVRIDETHS